MGSAAGAVVRADHPRMLFNKDDLKTLRERVKTTHVDTWREIKRWVDREVNGRPGDRWQSAATARMLGFVHQITGEDKYAKAGIRFLKHTVKFHLDKVRKVKWAANWENVKLRRKNYLAYDWLYNAMTAAERKAIGKMLLEIADIQAKNNSWNHAYAGGYGRYENDFFCGIALAKCGIDDKKAAAYVKSGFDFMFNQTVAGRNQVATDDGGIQSGMGYAFYNYIPVEAHFLAIWKSATGEDLFAKDECLKNFPVWAKYTITPSGEVPPICDSGDHSKVLTEKVLKGVGAVSANGQRLSYSLIASIYNDRRAAAMLPKPGRYWSLSGAHDILWRDGSIKPLTSTDDLPRGRHFEGMGWVAMRTGWKADSTYSIFTCGDYYYGHKHRDVNHFVIYYKGYLAADARQRIYQSSGHNTLLIYSGAPTDGDQRDPKGDNMVRVRKPIHPACDMGDIVAFETNAQYVYTCGDGKKAYSWSGANDYLIGRDRKKYQSQLESFTRQYVFLMPRTFVVYDRVVSIKPDARKVWQLHAWAEPELSAPGFVTRQGQGRLDCKTLIPNDPVIKKDYQKLTGAQDTKAELWRVTVEAKRRAKSEQFLHVLHATDRDKPQTATIRRIERDGTVGAEITADGFTYTVTFRTSGDPGGHVTVKKDGAVQIDKDLTAKVQPQSGWAVER